MHTRLRTPTTTTTWSEKSCSMEMLVRKVPNKTHTVPPVDRRACDAKLCTYLFLLSSPCTTIKTKTSALWAITQYCRVSECIKQINLLHSKRKNNNEIISLSKDNYATPLPLAFHSNFTSPDKNFKTALTDSHGTAIQIHFGNHYQRILPQEKQASPSLDHSETKTILHHCLLAMPSAENTYLNNDSSSTRKNWTTDHSSRSVSTISTLPPPPSLPLKQKHPHPHPNLHNVSETYHSRQSCDARFAPALVDFSISNYYSATGAARR